MHHVATILLVLFGSFVSVVIGKESEDIARLTPEWNRLNNWLSITAGIKDISIEQLLDGKNFTKLDKYGGLLKGCAKHQILEVLNRLHGTMKSDKDCDADTLKAIWLVDLSRPNLSGTKSPVLRVDRLLKHLMTQAAVLCESLSERNVIVSYMKKAILGSAITKIVLKYVPQMYGLMSLPTYDGLWNSNRRSIPIFKEIAKEIFDDESNKLKQMKDLYHLGSINVNQIFGHLLEKPCEQFISNLRSHLSHSRAVSYHLTGKEFGYLSRRTEQFKEILVMYQFCLYIQDVSQLENRGSYLLKLFNRT